MKHLSVSVPTLNLMQNKRNDQEQILSKIKGLVPVVMSGFKVGGQLPLGGGVLLQLSKRGHTD